MKTRGSIACNVALKLVSSEPRAVEATAKTIESLVPGEHYIARDGGGRAIVDAEEIYVFSTDPGYLVFAAVNQGYVLGARRLDR